MGWRNLTEKSRMGEQNILRAILKQTFKDAGCTIVLWIELLQKYFHVSDKCSDSIIIHISHLKNCTQNKILVFISDIKKVRQGSCSIPRKFWWENYVGREQLGKHEREIRTLKWISGSCELKCHRIGPIGTLFLR